MAEDSEYVLELLRREGEFAHYRGRDTRSHEPILAVAVAEQPSPESLRRLEHEYALATELDAAWAAQPLALTRYQGRSILILDDPGGEPLDRLIEQHRGHPIDLDRFLPTAIGLAAALGQVHGRGLIHKDIKPANVLVDDVGRVRLTGFGIASRLPRERQAPAAPEIVAGTLAYMSPEQTGRMNRSMDTRSDLYSVGITLYQMLIGVLPFVAADPLEWVHCHIARQPPRPADRGAVPEPISAIIMRLLAKNAEERYQTAAGLEADLQRCWAQWQALGRIDSFPLGADDSSDRLLIPEKLYGREREVNALLAAFDRVVAQGAVELVLVSGYSGVGKSSAVNELHKVLVPPRGLFAAGKFDQYKRDVPYATLAQAFQMLVRQILVKSEAELDQWRQALLEVLGPNGQLIVDLIPEVEFVIGKQPPVAELPPQEARGRFQLVFRRFLGAFARPEHPLALFLDDLQWLDTATLELLERLATDPDVRHVLIIGAYRDNEVSPSHPLVRTLAAIRDTGARVHEIALAPLGLDDVERLIADALKCGLDAAGPLALLVHDKTGGNPFFAIQLLTSLAEEGLLRFDRGARGWTWDLDRIRAKRYSGNVVDLMLAKLRRLPQPTQTALQQLACLGNIAEIGLLTAGFALSEEPVHTLLWEAVRAGLVLRLDGSYAFPHDRIQEAAYALIDAGARAELHLRIGRRLLRSLTPEGLVEHVFEVANQLNRGAELLIEHEEKVAVAAFDLRAGRKAKASAAYAAALAYFAAGMELLDEGDWSDQYELMFSLWLEFAECQLLTGNLDKAGEVIEQLLPRSASKIDGAAVYCLKVQLHVIESEHQQAVTTALMCLRGFGIDLPEHPTEQDIEAESDAVSHALGGRSIESLIDLPLMTDPQLLAAMKVLSVLSMSAQFTDLRLCCVQACRVVNLSVRYGVSGDSAAAYGFWGSLLAFVFPRYREGYLFSKLACDLVEKHSFIANRASILVRFAYVSGFTQPIDKAIESSRRSITAGIETGSPVWANYGVILCLTYRLLRGDPLDLVWHESEMALEVAQKARYEDAVALFAVERRFIATMRGGAAAHSTFNDADFDEATFVAQNTGRRAPIVMGRYWILKLMARLLSNDYAEAWSAAQNAKPLLGAVMLMEPKLNYFYCAALTVAALYETASAEQQQAWRQLLGEHQKQLGEWAENYPPTFADKLALVSAEIARIERRDADALRLYEEAIDLARANGFVQNQGLAHELAARYYLTRGLKTAGQAHLRDARSCYDRWGAHEKVRQLDERHPHLRLDRNHSAAAVIDPSVGGFDVETVVRASQALSREMVLPKLIERLMRLALEHAAAERGWLILTRGDEQRIEAEAATRHGEIDVRLPSTVVTPSELPQSALHYVIRTQESVLLDDASTDPVYSKDAYIRRNGSRSVLCLPIVKQTQLVGALCLENNLTPGAFTPERVSVLQLLASQAAISLENAGLYFDLQRSEAFMSQAQKISQTGSFGWGVASGEIYWSDETYNIVELSRGTKPTVDDCFGLVHPDDFAFVRRTLDDAVKEKTNFEFQCRLSMPDGRIKHVHVIGRAVDTGNLVFAGAIRDITERARTAEALRQAQDDLARVNRVTTMGELAASLAHEINQPISGAITNANVCLRKLAHDEPDLDGVRAAVTRIARDTKRAAEIIDRIRSQFRQSAATRELIHVNEIHQETVALLRDEAVRYNMSVRMDLAADLPPIVGDRVQLQQVMMNLIVNGIEAMKGVDGAREMILKSQRAEGQQILVSVSDTGIGFAPELAEQLFAPFFTTKPGGTGMGLRICRSIVESHGGRLWAVGTPGRGATFHFSLPAATGANA
ncbi:MAG TPA: AAA family ATPase [Steroidobacteraceae bacterium]|nr:AAA family ATPase [Steroidobacteraceae bacterium]